MRRLTLSALALMAASCSGAATNRSEPANQANQANEVTAEASGARIASLPEGARNAVFIRAIRDAGFDCQGVTGSVPAEPYRGMPVWTATCQGGTQWTLVIGENEIVQVLDANQARSIRQPPANGQ